MLNEPLGLYGYDQVAWQNPMQHPVSGLPIYLVSDQYIDLHALIARLRFKQYLFPILLLEGPKNLLQPNLSISLIFLTMLAYNGCQNKSYPQSLFCIYTEVPIEHVLLLLTDKTSCPLLYETGFRRCSTEPVLHMCILSTVIKGIDREESVTEISVFLYAGTRLMPNLVPC